MSRLVPPVGVNPTEFSVTVKGSPCQKLTSATWLPSWQRGHKTKPVQRLVLLLRTWEVSGVLPGCETGYADEELVQYNRTDTHTHTHPTKGHSRFLPHPSQFIIPQSLRAMQSEAAATCLRHNGPKTADKTQNRWIWRSDDRASW